MRLPLGCEKGCPICKIKYLVSDAIVMTVYDTEHCGNEQLHQIFAFKNCQHKLNSNLFLKYPNEYA